MKPCSVLKLSNETKNKNEETIENLKGLFVLGFLAVLVTVRVQLWTQSELIIRINEFPFDILPRINTIIILWSLYAFFKVFSYSGDLISSIVAEICDGIAQLWLGCGEIYVIWDASDLFSKIFPEAALYVKVLLLAGLLALLWERKFFSKLKEKFQRFHKFDWTEQISSITKIVGMLIYLLFFSLVWFGDTYWRVAYTLVGLLGILFYIKPSITNWIIKGIKK